MRTLKLSKPRIFQRKKFTVGDDENDAPSGIYVLSVSFIQARDLMKVDLIGSSDPYVIITCEGQQRRSRTIYRCLNPVWNQRFDFVCQEKPESFHVRVMDADKANKDEFLGEFTYTVTEKDWNETISPYQWIKLENAKRGEVQVQVACREQGEAEDVEELLDYVQTVGLATVRVVRARGVKQTVNHLKKLATFGLKGKRPLRLEVILEYGITAFRTKPQPGADPMFQQECRFWVRSGEEKYVMRISLYNNLGSRTALLGRGYVDLSKVISEEGGEYNLVVDIREDMNSITDADHVQMLSSSHDALPSMANMAANGDSAWGRTPSSKSVDEQAEELDNESAPITFDMDDPLSLKTDGLSPDPLNEIGEITEISKGLSVTVSFSPESPCLSSGSVSGNASPVVSPEFPRRVKSANMLSAHAEDSDDLSFHRTCSDSERLLRQDFGGSEGSIRGRRLHFPRLRSRERESKVVTMAKPVKKDLPTGSTELSFTTDDSEANGAYVHHHNNYECRGAHVGQLVLRIKYTTQDDVERWFFRRLLDEFDEEGRGHLNHEEVMAVLESMTSGHKLGDDYLDNLLKRLDKDGDGQLKEEELVEYLRSAEFQSQPMSYTLLAFLADGAAGLSSLISNTYTTTGTYHKDTRAGAGILTVRDGDRVIKTIRNLRVLDRTTGLLVEEHIPKYIKIALRLLYSTLAGKGTTGTKRVQRFLKRMSVKEGLKMDSPESVSQIRPFIATHKMSPEDWLLPVDAENKNYPCFNAFFYRKLKPSARPIECLDNDRVAVSPADCRMVVFQNLMEATKLWIKGSEFTIENLLTPQLADIAPLFHGGSIAIARLAPQDYHRWHWPVSGTLGRKVVQEGAYYTVNPIAIRQPINVYTENIRTIHECHTKDFGLMLMVCIGATMVGSVNITSKDHAEVKKGDEHGYFAFGGSTVLVLWQPGKIVFDRDLVDNSRKPLETLVRMGMRIGEAAASVKEKKEERRFQKRVASMNDLAAPVSLPQPQRAPLHAQSVSNLSRMDKGNNSGPLHG
eukprot:comp23042_c0_seq1/m.36864 comp23042_c0_seq1/g.36864  ORF comp23042_c0_seq1/g.36864 comp23042_c0_seq1/m.36864 type:complete len:1024 (-) comp23042_c0_seq1:370-3441(-)